MNRISLFRTTLLGIATAFGALGIFLLYYGCMSTPVGDYGVVFLAIPLAITWFVDQSAKGT